MTKAFVTSLVSGVVLSGVIIAIALAVLKHKRKKRITYNISKKVRSWIARGLVFGIF